MDTVNKGDTTPINGSIHEWNTVLDTSHGVSDVFNVSSTGNETTPNNSSDLGQVYTCIYLRVYSKLSVRLNYFFLLFLKWPSASSERILNELKRNEFASCAHGY